MLRICAGVVHGTHDDEGVVFVRMHTMVLHATKRNDVMRVRAMVVQEKKMKNLVK
jgi:hypothetical protein